MQNTFWPFVCGESDVTKITNLSAGKFSKSNLNYCSGDHIKAISLHLLHNLLTFALFSELSIPTYMLLSKRMISSTIAFYTEDTEVWMKVTGGQFRDAVI